MELKTIPIEDVIPDPNNPRRDFGDLEALADSFELNANAPGEPVNPPVVVQDGSMYRLIDGERRYRAMKKRGQVSEIHAVVCADADEANAMLSMLTTDDKEQLTEAERSRGVQQMLLLGVDPVKVERAGRIGRGSAARVRRAMDAAGEKAETMTLDFLLALDECETAEERSKLLGCSNDDFGYELERIKGEREKHRVKAAMEAAAAACDLPLASSEGELVNDGLKYLRYVDWQEEGFEDALRDAVEEEAAEGVEGIVGVAVSYGYIPDIRLFGKCSEDAHESAEEAARRERRDAIGKAAKQTVAAWRAFILAHADGSAPASTEWLCKNHVSDWDRKCIERDFNVGLDDGTLPASMAAGPLLLLMASDEMPTFGGITNTLADGRADFLQAGSWVRNNVRTLFEWRSALDEDGYMASDAEGELMGLLERLCEQADALADEDEEEEGE